jgi:hypothetical protein
MFTSDPIFITKADGTLEPFNESKLVESLTNAGGTPEAIRRTVEHVKKKIAELAQTMPQATPITSSDIYRHAFDILRRESMPVATKYSLRRALSELGPNGFPFERYVADVFKAWHYETLTDQIIKGSCVGHEVDVVAWNADKLIMVEAKFHNEFGLKSDLKVALYVKARFDDIKASGAIFDYRNDNKTRGENGGTRNDTKLRALDEGWLVTNTKFTSEAIRYGECAGLRMIGWNYPARGNLHDLITESHLHPFTCLTMLSNVDKKNLLERGVILCKDITPEILKEIGLPPEKISAVESEISQVTGI